MKLVQNWKQAWKWTSVQIFAVLTALPFVWISLPDDLKSRIPTDWTPYIIAAVAVAGLVGRLRDQGGGNG